jgi:hypothetical protein
MKPNDIKSAFEESHLDSCFCYDKNSQGQYLDCEVDSHYASFLMGVLHAQKLRIEDLKKKLEAT